MMDFKTKSPGKNNTDNISDTISLTIYGDTKRQAYLIHITLICNN